MNSSHHRIFLFVIFGAVALNLCSGPLSGAETEITKHFETEVRPILAAHCVKCHGPTKQEGELRLDSRKAFLKGGSDGPLVVAGKPAESLLVEAVRYESLEMPPNEQLGEESIAAIVKWVEMGGTWPDHAEPIRATRTISAEDRDWWAFRPLTGSHPPEVKNAAWCQNDLDQFVLHKLETQSLRPAPRATKTVLLRRAYYDLLGLPPTPEQVVDFLSDDSPEAWERQVDRLLDDPRYGENWGRHWLDVVRYAESDGWNQDAFRSHIWRYRDYVVQSFNDDKPYAEFVIEQLAGDQIPESSPDTLVATGYLRLGIFEYNQRDARGHWNDIMNEMTDVTGDVFLGLGMACARCHDHKFDPILQVDYFKLRAFFEPVIWRDDLTLATEAGLHEHQESQQPWIEATAEIRAKIDAMVAPYHEKKWTSTIEKFPLDIQACFNKPVDQRNSWEHQMAYLVERQFYEEGGGPLKALSKEDKVLYDKLQTELQPYEHLKPKSPSPIMVATDFQGAFAPTKIPDRTDAETIPPGFPTVVAGSEAGVESNPRLSLAQWIGSADNALTHRVMANRIWHHHFGVGLAATPNDFGSQGQAPSHPRLLDWLTRQFVTGGGRAKPIHKMILMSAVWQQSAHHPEAKSHEQKDPQEKLLWRGRIRRLTAEQIRDTMLTISGELDDKIGGPSVDGDSQRRSLYIKRLRNTPDKFLHAFDVANGLKSVAERNSTTTPTQALLLLNGKYTRARADAFSARLAADSSATAESCLSVAIRSCWGREPTSDEFEDALGFLGCERGIRVDQIAAGKLAEFCHILFNSNEFLYID